MTKEAAIWSRDEIGSCHLIESASDGSTAKFSNQKGDDKDGEDVERGSREPIPYLLGVITQRHMRKISQFIKEIVT